MNKKKEQELVCLTEQCLKRYWEKDCEVMLSYCTDDILWTGAEQKEYIMGIEAVRKNFTELMNVIQPCIISNGEFIVVQNTGNACTVSGRCERSNGNMFFAIHNKTVINLIRKDN